MKYDNQLRYAAEIIKAFNGAMPLHNWLKDFFRQHKQMGSRDRKQASEMVYCFYRLGHASTKLSVDERILTGLFLCNHSSNEILQYFKPSWNEQIGLNMEEKIALISNHKNQSASDYLEKIFPWSDQLTNGIDHLSYCSSFLSQPDLFIRLRPGFENQVKNKLDQRGVGFREINSSCLALDNTTKLDELLELDKEAVIQDLNSQRIGSFFENSSTSLTEKIKVWDCCSGSGGKSLMIHDLYPQISLTVSDIRESILVNLKKRFQHAGIKNYRAVTADLSNQYVELPLKKSSCDMIIVDTPCTGSGTWARNPDALYFFDVKELNRYQELQKKIVSRIIPCLKKGGSLVYITCSVFKKENEEMVDFIQQHPDIVLEKMELLRGDSQKADSMFVARFTA